MECFWVRYVHPLHLKTIENIRFISWTIFRSIQSFSSIISNYNIPRYIFIPLQTFEALKDQDWKKKRRNYNGKKEFISFTHWNSVKYERLLSVSSLIKNDQWCPIICFFLKVRSSFCFSHVFCCFERLHRKSEWTGNNW